MRSATRCRSEAFLDERLVYSCAYFADPDEDLGAAQVRKLDMICRKLRLRPGMRLLDIGCAWGSLLRHSALHHGVTGVGITLSRTQVEAARARLAREGLGDRVEIRLADYRELPDEPFDAVASVGMAEHVGEQQLATYFAIAARLLRPGALLLNHMIVSARTPCRGTAPRPELRRHARLPRRGAPPRVAGRPGGRGRGWWGGWWGASLGPRLDAAGRRSGVGSRYG